MARGQGNVRVSITSDTTGLQRGSRDAAKALQLLGKESQKTHGALRTVGKGAAYALGAGGFGGGLYALFDITKKSISEFRESQKVTRQTNAVLQSTGGIAKVSAKHVQDLANAISRKSGVDDEAIASGENLLLTFTKIRNEQGKGNQVFDQATQIITDMSAALGQDMKSSAIQVGKALNDPIKGVTALQRVGVSFTSQQRDQIKTLVEHGKALDAQKLILKELTTEFGGSAAATATSGDKLKVTLGNLAEAIGKGVAPSLTRTAEFLNKFVNQMLSGTGSGGRFVEILKNIGRAISDVVRWVVSVVNHFKEHRTQTLLLVSALSGLVAGFVAFRVVLTVVGYVKSLITTFKLARASVIAFDLTTKATVVGALVGLGVALVVAYKHSEKFRDIVNGVFRAVRIGVGKFLDVFLGFVSGFLRGIQSVLEGAGHLPGVGGKFRSAARAVDKAADSIDNLREHARTGFGATSQSARNMAKAVTEAAGQFQGQINALAKAAGIKTIPLKAVPQFGTLDKPGQSVTPKALGGPIGTLGQSGRDTVPIMVAPGEAVLNRHQQGPVEYALQATYGMGLGDLFDQVQTPHYMAKGGIAGMIGAANQLDKAHFPYVWGGGHQGSPAPFGPMDCSGAVSYVLQRGGVNVPTMTSGQLAGAGKPGAGAVTVFANAKHTFMRIGDRYFGTSGSNPGGGAGWFPAPGAGYLSGFAARSFAPGDSAFGTLGRVIISGGRGSAYQKVAQGGADRMRGIGQRWLDAAIGSMGLGTGDSGDPGPGGYVSTAYGPPWGGIQGGGVTATGVDLRRGPKRYIVAVDPSVIPLHSRLRITPNPFGYSGAFSAEDTGGAIKGNRIDFYDWRGRGAQNSWGRRTVQIMRMARGGFIRAAKGKKPKVVARKPQKVTGRRRFPSRYKGFATPLKLSASTVVEAAQAQMGQIDLLVEAGDIDEAEGLRRKIAILDKFEGTQKAGSQGMLQLRALETPLSSDLYKLDHPESTDDPNQPLIDAINAAAQAEAEHTAALNALQAEVKRQNDFAQSVTSIEGAAIAKSLADFFNGEIGAITYSRSLTPGNGSVVRYRAIEASDHEMRLRNREDVTWLVC